LQYFFFWKLIVAIIMFNGLFFICYILHLPFYDLQFEVITVRLIGNECFIVILNCCTLYVECVWFQLLFAPQYRYDKERSKNWEEELDTEEIRREVICRHSHTHSMISVTHTPLTHRHTLTHTLYCIMSSTCTKV